MGTTKLVRLAALGLALLAASCERGTVKEPGADGPSTAMLTFELSADPTILVANESRRDSSLVKAVLRKGGVPVKDAVVHFSLQGGPAVFADYTSRSAAVSNEYGIAAVTVLGPLKSEMSGSSTNVVVTAEIDTSSTLVTSKEIVLRVLGPEAAAFTFDVTANPGILYAGETTRETSALRAVLKNGPAPVRGAVVYFTIKSGPAFFVDGTLRTAAVTDDGGIASAALSGPLKSDLTESEASIVVSADVVTPTPLVLSKEVTIRVLGPDPTSYTLTLTAGPNLLSAGETTRPTSIIQAVLKNGIFPVRNTVVYFTVQSGPALFADATWRNVAVTNDAGAATVVLMGALKSELDVPEANIVVSAEVAVGTRSIYQEVIVRILKSPLLFGPLLPRP